MDDITKREIGKINFFISRLKSMQTGFQLWDTKARIKKQNSTLVLLNLLSTSPELSRVNYIQRLLHDYVVLEGH